VRSLPGAWRRRRPFGRHQPFQAETVFFIWC
jgi:hypothetical protein